MIKVMLVDDHDLVRTGVKRLLDDVEDVRVIAEASSGEEAMSLIRKVDPDIVLMDINMPGIGGLEATRKLLHLKPAVKIIVVSMHDDDLFPQRLLQAGASGYVTKGASIEEIVHAMREVLANRRYICPEIAQQMALSNMSGHDSSPFETLSERELQVMLMLMDGQKVNDISDKLCLSPKTVSTYRYRLYDKLGVNNDMELAKLAMLHGVMSGIEPH